MATNFVKYGSTSKNVLIKSNNFNVGSDDIDDYGPTSSTGFYSGIEPPTNGYVIYVDKATQGPSIHVAQDDTSCIFFLKSFGSTGSTINDVLLWAQNQSNILVIGKTQPSINPSGLVAYYDIGTISSYPKGGSTLYDLSGNNYHVTLYNTPTYISTGTTSLSFSKNSFEYGETSTSLPDLNNFTVESRFRVTSSLSGQVTAIVTGQYDLSSKLNFSLGTNNAPTNYNIAIGFFNGVWRTTTGFTPTLNTWYHVTGTYDGSSLKMYVDGVLSQTLNYVGTPQSGGVLRIARRWDDVNNNSVNFFPGDIEFVRIYNKSLTSTEVTRNYIKSQGNFNNPSFTVGSAVSVVSQSPFSGGGNSYEFIEADTNSYIDVPASSDWAVGTGDFTIEWFSYQTTTAIPPYQRIFTVDDYPSMDIGVSNEGGTFYYWANSSFRYNSTSAISTNTWEHWAVVRQSGVTKVYKDGTLRGSQFNDTNDITNITSKLTIGADNGHATNATFVGYLTNFRWVKGLAVYTGNFTKPTSTLTAITTANPYGGSNTQAIPSGYTKLLLVP